VDQEIRHLVDELARRPEVLGLALFGSVARGDARPDSDVDVFVLVKEGMWRDVEERGQRHGIGSSTLRISFAAFAVCGRGILRRLRSCCTGM
jgi:tRNA nucleotidyltransferase (CCA-adding enzyme)